MRHRIGIAASAGLGNPAPEVISNQSTGDAERNHLIRAAAKDCYKLFGFEKYGCYCDARENSDEIRFGVESACQHEPLKLIAINRRKEFSRYTRDIAWGYYGSQIACTTREYDDYKRRSKFVRFVDKWHVLLYATGDASA